MISKGESTMHNNVPINYFILLYISLPLIFLFLQYFRYRNYHMCGHVRKCLYFHLNFVLHYWFPLSSFNWQNEKIKFQYYRCSDWYYWLSDWSGYTALISKGWWISIIIDHLDFSKYSLWHLCMNTHFWNNLAHNNYFCVN